jgi:hypothetical protein
VPSSRKKITVIEGLRLDVAPEVGERGRKTVKSKKKSRDGRNMIRVAYEDASSSTVGQSH